MGRPKLDKELTSPYSVQRGTIDKLEFLALSLGYKHGSGAAMGRFLDMVANLNPDLLALIAQKNDVAPQNKAESMAK
jgi:hypothetical protein